MRAEGDVWVANYNAPGQVVIAGTAEAVAVAGELAKGLGAKRVMPIPVSGAFHTPLMQGARADLRKALAEVTFLAPEVRVVANVDAHVHDDPAEWPGLLSAQLCSPVRWRQTLETFAGLGLTSLVELGPGGVLSGLAKRSLPEIQSLAVSKPEDLDTLMDQIGSCRDVAGRTGPAPGRAPLHVRARRGQPLERDLQPGGLAARAGHRAVARDRRRPRAVVGGRGRRPGRPRRRLRGAHPVRGPGDPLAGGRRRAGPGGPAARLAPRSRTRADGRRPRDRRHPRHRRGLRRVVPGQRRPGCDDVSLCRAAGGPEGAAGGSLPPGAVRRPRPRRGRCGVRRHRGAVGPRRGLGCQRRDHDGLAAAPDERAGVPRRDRRQPHGVVPGGQARRGQDAPPARGPHHLRLVGRSLRRAPRTGQLRRIEGGAGRHGPCHRP